MAKIRVDRLPAAVIEPSDDEVRWIRAYANHGDHVTGMGNDTAHSCIEMPIVAQQ